MPDRALQALADDSSLELASEAITVRIRWFGVAVGFVLVNFAGRETNAPVLNTILSVGAAFAALDSYWSYRGKVFLGEQPLFISLMEALFIGLLCHFDVGLESPFRFYYFLSLVVCAIRNTAGVTYATFLLHALSFAALLFPSDLPTDEAGMTVVLMAIWMGWVTWASVSLASLLKTARRRVSQLNDALQQNQSLLEQRIRERTQDLQESQAVLVQQEKQAAFGLLAAGIAHEVGNPLAAISSLVQLMNRRATDDYMRQRLPMIDDQLSRIHRTLRELVDFSRPANHEASLCDIHDVIQAALSIAKYYK